jgi:hypothetical protein
MNIAKTKMATILPNKNHDKIAKNAKNARGVYFF